MIEQTTTEAAAETKPHTSPSPPIAPLPAPASKPEPAVKSESSRVEHLAEQILAELKRRNEHAGDFSVSKLLAGIVQIVAIATLFVAFLHRGDPNPAETHTTLLFAIFLQMLTVALLIMGRQR